MSAEVIEQFEGSFGDHRAGRVHRDGAHLQERRNVVGWDHTADGDLDVGATQIREFVA